MRALTTYAGATLPALLVLGFFVWFANWIPQTRWEAPKIRAIDAGASAAELAVLGQAIARERGCLACHTIEPGAGIKGQGRGPNLDGLAVRRENGVEGGADTLAAYLTEALYTPGAWLVEGYANIMPAAVKAPARLSREEVAAVVAWLQSLGGTPSVTLATLPAPPEGSAAAAPAEAVSADPRAMLDAFDCLGCHSLAPGEVLVGPPFDAARLRAAADARGVSPSAYVMRSIVDPRAFESADFPAETMPDDYGTRLSAAQLFAITEYLIAREGGQ